MVFVANCKPRVMMTKLGLGHDIVHLSIHEVDYAKVRQRIKFGAEGGIIKS